MKKKFSLLILLVIFVPRLISQSIGDFQSYQSGNWHDINTWSRWDGSAWVNPAPYVPTHASAGVITILNGHTINVTTSLQVDQTVINAGGTVNVTGGTLTINGAGTDPDMRVYGRLKLSGATASISSTAARLYIENNGVYEHARNSGTIPTATWNDGSTCELTGLVNTDAAGTTQNFYHLVWKNSGQTSDIVSLSTTYRNIRGTCSVISTGTASWIWTSNTTATKNIGNYEQTGGTVNMSSGTGSMQIYLSGDFIMSGGTLTESGTATNCGWNFQKVGTCLFNKSGGTISQTIYFNVVELATLDIVNQPLTGLGNFTLNSGAGLVIRNANGITTNTASGAVQVAGTRTYSTGANYIYEGAPGQSAGDGLPDTVNNLIIRTSGGISGTLPTTLKGYEDIINNYIKISSQNGTITNFSISMSETNLMPLKIDREWNIQGDIDSGDKIVTFYWNENDDDDFLWDYYGKVPSVYKDGTELIANNYDTGASLRWVEVSVSTTLTKGTYRVGPSSNDDFLSIELSSFTAIQTNQSFVQLNWTTQTETNVAGYYIYRSNVPNLYNASIVSPLIPATNSSSEANYSFTDEEVGIGTWYYWLQNIDIDGGFSYHGPVSVTVSGDNDGSNTPNIPLVTSIQNIYPNPFNPITTIAYGVRTAGPINLSVYNMKGQLIRTLVADTKTPGNYRIRWDGKDEKGNIITSGIYYIKMTTSNRIHTKKVVFAK